MNNFTKSPVRNFGIFVFDFIVILALTFLASSVLNYDVTWAFACGLALIVALWNRLSFLFCLSFFDLDIIKSRYDLNKVIDELNSYDVSKKNVIGIIKRKMKK